MFSTTNENNKRHAKVNLKIIERRRDYRFFFLFFSFSFSLTSSFPLFLVTYWKMKLYSKISWLLETKQIMILIEKRDYNVIYLIRKKEIKLSVHLSMLSSVCLSFCLSWRACLVIHEFTK